jgi:hypothetical protein
MSSSEIPVDQAVPIGTKLQLRARISTESVWKYVKLMEVTVSSFYFILNILSFHCAIAFQLPELIDFFWKRFSKTVIFNFPIISGFISFFFY